MRHLAVVTLLSQPRSKIKQRGFTLIEIMTSLGILGLVAAAVIGSLLMEHERESEAHILTRKSDRLLAKSKAYYRSSCRDADFQLTLNKLKQKQLLDNSFVFPEHQLSITAIQTPAARIHLEITLNRALMTSFLEANPKAQQLDDDTIRITLPASSQTMPERKRLLSMKALWGESSC